MLAGRVGGAAADDARHRDLADELLQVQRLALRGDVLGRDHGALDHEDVEPGLERGLVVLGHPLRGQRARGDRAGRLDLLHPLCDQLRLHRLAVDLLHQRRRLLRRRRGDLAELRLGVLVAAPDALEVEHPETTEAAELGRGRRADDAVHRRGEQRQLEAVGPQGPGDVDVVGVARASRGHDRDLVENIDIGGPAMIRAAAKNHDDVAVVVEAQDYQAVLDELTANKGATTLTLRRRLAAKAYARTAAYDAAISNWFALQLKNDAPDFRAFGGRLIQSLRYGENPHQTAAFYSTPDKRPGVATARQLQGKELSYNNINDTDAAYGCIGELIRSSPRPRHRQARQTLRGRRRTQFDYRLSQGVRLRYAVALWRHHRRQSDARRRSRARHNGNPDRNDHRARRDGRGHRASRSAKTSAFSRRQPARSARGRPHRKTVAGGLLVQSRDNAVVDNHAEDGDKTRADRRRAARPPIRVPRRQARQVEHHHLCQRPRHRRHRRRSESRVDSARIAARKARMPRPTRSSPNR